jgi:hypothetical protein
MANLSRLRLYRPAQRLFAALRLSRARRFHRRKTLHGESSKPMTSLLWLVRLAKPHMRADEPGPEIADSC